LGRLESLEYRELYVPNLFVLHAGLIMRPKIFLFKHHRFNFEFICNNFGKCTSFMLKRWIDTNYKLIRAISQVFFLKQCKLNNLLPVHLRQILTNKFQLNHYKSNLKFERILGNFQRKTLQIEIFDLHRSIHSLNKELSHLSHYLINLLPTFIWKEIFKHHTCSFQKF